MSEITNKNNKITLRKVRFLEMLYYLPLIVSLIFIIRRFLLIPLGIVEILTFTIAFLVSTIIFIKILRIAGNYWNEVALEIEWEKEWNALKEEAINNESK